MKPTLMMKLTNCFIFNRIGDDITETISITAISAAVAFIAAIYAMKRDSKRDTQQTTTDTVAMREEVKYISKGVDEIKYDTRSLTTSISLMNERLIKAEANITIMNDRLDKHIEHDSYI